MTHSGLAFQKRLNDVAAAWQGSSTTFWQMVSHALPLAAAGGVLPGALHKGFPRSIFKC